MKDKKLIITIILTILILTILVILNINANNIEPKLESYLKKENFKLTEGTRTYYKKLSKIDRDTYLNNIDQKINSNTEYLYFNIDDYSLTNTYMEYENDITRYFTGLYNYQESKLTFIYEVTHSDVYVTVNGSYDTLSKKYKCNIDSFNSNENPNTIKNKFCNTAKYHVTKFANTASSLFNNNILEKMKKNM